MAASRGPHVKELFAQNNTPANNFVSTTYSATGFSFDKKEDESKPKYKSTKKTTAPPRPKFGDYKPKILQVDSIVNVPISQKTPTSIVPKEKQNGFTAKPLIIGDKDVPIVIAPIEPNDDEVYTEIPDDSDSEAAMTIIHQNGQTTTNPLYDNGDKSSHGNVVGSRRHNSGNKITHNTTKEEINGVSVPEPDYDEDEVTMEFDGEGEMDQNDATKNRENPAYKDFEGEDFSKYMNDEMECEPITYKKARNGRTGTRTEGKRYKKRDSRSPHTMFGTPTKNGKFKSGSVRNYSVEDTKLGLTVDGTVKGKSIKNGVNYGTSYESFLNSRHGTAVDNGGVDSSRRDTSIEDSYPMNGKQTLWKKFTWRLKRHIVMMHWLLLNSATQF